MTWWDHVRGALIAVVLVANGIYALPLPPALSAKEIEEHAEDLDTWVGILGAVGVEISRDELGQHVRAATAQIAKGHKLLKTPFKPLFDLVGANQAWALFSSASTRPDRLEVQVKREGSEEWQTLLRRLDPCCTWHEGQLEYRRIRGVWDGQGDKMRPGYKGLSKWIAGRVFDELPDARSVRVRMLRGRATYPWEEPNPEVKPALERIHHRAEIVGEGP